jgi:hypothetical protein
VLPGAEVLPADEGIRSGGWGARNAYDAYLEEFLEEIQDPVDREIAELLHDDPGLTELDELVRESYSERDRQRAEEYSDRVARAYERAYRQGNYSALMAFEREMERAIEEEEFFLMAIMWMS